jgi:hypothetical protein
MFYEKLLQLWPVHENRKQHEKQRLIFAQLFFYI